MIIIIYSLFDILAALALLFPNLFGNFTIWIIAFLLFKAISSFIGSFLSGFYFEIMGAIDLLVALCLIFSWSIPFLWLIIAVKGLWSITMGLLS